jgi:hypothetical protein
MVAGAILIVLGFLCAGASGFAAAKDRRRDARFAVVFGIILMGLGEWASR